MFQKVLFIWSSMQIFSFIGYTLTELLRKPDNWWQIIEKQVRLFIHQTMFWGEKILIRHKVVKELLKKTLKKNTEAATGGAEAVTRGVL